MKVVMNGSVSAPCITTVEDQTEVVNAVSAAKEVIARMTVNNTPVVFQVDSGASVNILPRSYLRGKAIEE